MIPSNNPKMSPLIIRRLRGYKTSSFNLPDVGLAKMFTVRLEKFYLEHPQETLLTPHAGHGPDVGHGVHGQLGGLLEHLSLHTLGVDDDPHMKVGGSYEHGCLFSQIRMEGGGIGNIRTF